jgi:hypothetical protein
VSIDRHLADRAGILDTVTAYFVALDHCAFDRLERVFTSDATADFDGTACGPDRDAIIAHVSGLGTNFTLSHHQMSNHLAHIDGDDAYAETYAVASLVGAGQVRTRGLRYQDHLVRTDAGWRIRRREHVCDWMRVDDLTSAAPAIAPLPHPTREVLHA